MKRDLNVIIVMAGGGAAGKTTTTQHFVQGDPVEYTEMRVVDTAKGLQEKPCKWTVYENVAITGNHRSGTDSNTGPGLVKAALWECLAVSDLAIIDGMISSPKWALFCNEATEFGKVHVLLVYFKFTAEQLLERLANRRGTTPDAIPDMYKKCSTLVRRAELLDEHFTNLATVPVTRMYVDYEWTPNRIVQEMDKNLEAIYQEYGKDYYGI